MKNDHWNSHANQWQHIGVPLRPSLDDVMIVEQMVQRIRDGLRRPLRALLLGVTPELATMNWPLDTILLAVDSNPAMIRQVWPHEKIKISANAVQGNWLNLPLESESIDLVIGDGCYNALDVIFGYPKLSDEVRRVLYPHGNFIIRCFTRPLQSESVECIFDDLRTGMIGNFHIFKWRLAMALQPYLEKGVRLGDIWDTWYKANIDVEALAKQNNWPEISIHTIENYQKVDACYTFPSYDEFEVIMTKYFTLHDCHTPTYELGECCPNLWFKKEL